MADKIDPKTAEELAKATAAVKASAAETTRAFEDQLRIITQMRDVMNQLAASANSLCQQESGVLNAEKMKEVTKELEKATSSASTTSTAFSKLSGVLKKTFSTAALTAVGAITGMVQGFKNLFAMTRAVGNFFGSVASGALSIGRSIISIPFKMMDGLIGMAKKGGGGNELAAAYEEVVKSFGDLKTGMGKAVVDAGNGLDKANKTGIDTTRIFGNMAERMKAAKEMAEGLGPAFSQFQQEVDENGGALMIFNKGLGITNDQMAGIASAAMRMGKSINDVQMSMTKQSLGMSKAFGLNAKVLSKDMAKAMQDLAHFGHLSSKEMGVTAAFAQKMGVSIDKLVSVMDSTSTFDQAAEGMSKLNEQFGTNIDATAIMSAQSPQEKIALLSKEFARTGKDLSKLTFQERQLIKTSAGLTDEVLDSMAKHGDMSDMLSDLNAQADKNEDKTMSQAEAMKELSKSIDKLTPSGSAKEGGIFSHIFQGFGAGLQSTKEFRDIMHNINKVLREAYLFGVKLGKTFVDAFPGVKDMFGGLADMFNPQRFKKMFDGVLKAFDVFKAGGSGKMEDFMDNIKKVFGDFFNESTPSGKKFIEGFHKFKDTVLTIFGKLSEYVIKKLATIVNDITAWLKKPKLPDVGGATDGMGKAITTPFMGAIEAFKKELKPALTALADQLWKMLKDAIFSSTGMKVMAGAAAVVLGPALMGGLTGAKSAGLFKNFGKSMGGLLGDGIKAGSPDGIQEGMEATGQAMLSSPAERSAKALPDKETIDKMTEAAGANINWAKLTKFLVGMAGFFGVGLLAFKVALEVVKNEDAKNLVAAGIVLAAVIPVINGMMAGMGDLAFAMELVQQLGASISMKNVIAGLAAMGLGIVALAGTAFLITKMLGDLKATQMLKAVGISMAMIPAFIAVGLVIAEAAVIGSAIIASGGAGAAALVVGMVAMGAAIAAIAYTGKKIIEMLGTVKMSALAAAVAVTSAMTVAFVAVGAVIAETATIGTAIVLSAGVGAVLIAAGMLALSGSVRFMASTAVDVIQMLAGVKVTEALKASTITSAMMVLFGAAGAVIIEAALIGDFVLATGGTGGAAIVLGMAAIAASIYVMAKTADLLIEAMGKIDVNSMTKTAAVMTAMAGAYVVIGGVIIEAAAIGTFIIGTLGLGGLAIKKGMDLIKDTLTYMSDAAVGIMKSLDEIKGGADLEAKSKSFSAIVSGIGSIAGSVAKIMDTIPLDDILEKSDSPAILSKVGEIIDGIIKGGDGTGGLIGVVKTITDSLPNLDKSKIESANALGSVLQAVGGLLTAILAPAQEISKQTRGWFSSGPDFKESLDNIKTFMEEIKTPLQGIITNVGEAITKVGGTSADSLKSGGEAIGSILGSVTSLVSSVMEQGKDPPKLEDKAADAIKQLAGKSAPTITQVMNELKDNIPGLISAVTDVVSKVPGDKEFKDRLSSVQSLLGIIKDIPSIIKGMNDASKDDKGNATSINTGNLVDSIRKISTFFKDIFLTGGNKSPMAEMFNTLSSPAVAKFKGLKGNIDGVKSTFDMITSITSAVKNLGSLSEGGKTFDDATAWSLASAVHRVRVFLMQMTTWPWKADGDYKGGPAPFVDMATSLGSEAVKNLVKQKANITGLKDAIASTIELAKVAAEASKIPNIDTDNTANSMEKVAIFYSKIVSEQKEGLGNKTILGSLSSQLNAASAYLPGIKKSADTIKTNGLIPAIEMVRDVVKAVQDLDTALDMKNGIDIKARLGAIAQGAGLGAKAQYTVDSKPVHLIVNFEISMDVAEVEKVIITRHQSVIRDRINFVLDNAVGVSSNASTPNAKIKSSGVQSGPVAPNAAP